MAPRLSAHLTIMANAAQRAAKQLLRDFNEVEQLQVSIKGPADFVSQADLKAEAVIKQDLNKARPGYAFLMEESGASGSDNWTWRWVVDPLDGTTNFLHGMPHWAISIGLERRLPDGAVEIAAGVIYAPATDEMFWAEKGSGAFMNDRRLRVSAGHPAVRRRGARSRLGRGRAVRRLLGNRGQALGCLGGHASGAGGRRLCDGS
jgi:myo-inositol-1(or 4)-monophosphatase